MAILLENPRLNVRYNERDRMVYVGVIFAELHKGGEAASSIASFIDSNGKAIWQIFSTFDSASIGVCDNEADYLECKAMPNDCDEGRVILMELEEKVRNLQGMTSARGNLTRSFEEFRQAITARAA